MSNILYSLAKESLLKGEINLVNDDLKVLFVKNSYTLNADIHQFVADIGNENIAARSTVLDGKSVTLGTFDAENETVENYGTSGFSYIIIYVDTGDDSTSPLLAYIDTATGLPVQSTSSEVSITIQWSDLSSKIFTL